MFMGCSQVQVGYMCTSPSPSSCLGKDHQLVPLTPQTAQVSELACQCVWGGGGGRGGGGAEW